MFCYQCEQTARGTGCTNVGVCGKEGNIAALQDLLIYAAKGISMYAHRAKLLGKTSKSIERFVIEALFSTVTNVNFDAKRLEVLLKNSHEHLANAKNLYLDACKSAGKEPEKLSGPANFIPASSLDELTKQGEAITIANDISSQGEEIVGLQHLVLFGLKGMAAYTDHALILNVEDQNLNGFFFEALDFLSTKPSDVNALLGMALKVGEMNLKAMELLDKANTDTYGHPVPTKVRVTPIKGKAILISGHDLKDLHELLKQTEGKNINIYTHGEMLPAHGYPELHKYKHLVGNYGGAWQEQKKDFDEFPGSILMTTNCIQKPKDTYTNRIFTTGLVAYENVEHVTYKDFGPVIKAAQEAKGFTEDEPEKSIMVGFGRNAVMSVADKVIDAVKAGKLSHFFLIGGCDGAKPGRNYYTDFAKMVPNDSVILTLACGKYRFNKLDFGDIDGIPRLLDIGQCNDAYSAIQIAVALANAFKTDVNSLPLSLVLSWYEQKAVCILLTLLYLGIKNIRLGPSLPAFVKPSVLNILVEKFSIAPISTPEEDLKAIMKK